MLIAIEGIDAAGKHTQSKLLAEALQAKLFSFPDYKTPIGHIIKGHLKGYWEAAPVTDTALTVDKVGDVDLLNAFIFQALQTTNRMEHATAIAEHLNDDVHVVADRYWQSGWVYGQADGLDPEWLLRIQCYLPQPDLNLLLDIPPGHSTSRRPERRDRYEKQAGLMDTVSKLYRKLWRHRSSTPEPGRWVTIDGIGTIDEVHQRIIQAVERHVDRATYSKIELPWRAAS